ncbi:RnfH family protein [Pseudomonas daroniae]|uniref:UPF0125 protein DNK06_04245 n=1 Tax=Phytopseudomonas daroniae TaxID=2487519 RepID=A0A4V2KB52_9GAMM|nr:MULTISPECIES: RnfH family protein [Pseudomonas]TBU78562.1 RnfH family protein [Pseudomonas daroniae]TBU82774.1 RnfH family protein [Pseudomonas daroniae]TBU86026.1 RnfH family protein [Pseudomonas sp. FRB 228]TBU95189.1 RnfH family protein [Pseudomonas daroniae]
MASEWVSVEVVFAAPDRQLLIKLQLPSGSTVRQAALQSGLQDHFPDIDLAGAPLGIFGKAVVSPEARVLEEGDRVEIYRPLLADPKDVRKRRAAQAVERAKLAGDAGKR